MPPVQTIAQRVATLEIDKNVLAKIKALQDLGIKQTLSDQQESVKAKGNLLAELKKIEAAKFAEQVRNLEKTKLDLESPTSDTKTAFAAALAFYYNFQQKILQNMFLAMQKIVQMPPAIAKKYGGNVVKATPTALAVALALANRLAQEQLAKSRAERLEKALDELMQLMAKYTKNLLSMANLQQTIMSMILSHCAKNSTAPTAEKQRKAEKLFYILVGDTSSRLGELQEYKEYAIQPQKLDHLLDTNNQEEINGLVTRINSNNRFFDFIKQTVGIDLHKVVPFVQHLIHFGLCALKNSLSLSRLTALQQQLGIIPIEENEEISARPGPSLTLTRDVPVKS